MSHYDYDPVVAQQVAAARMKSYTGSAILVFFLYWLFFLPGLIANILYYGEAKRAERIAGQGLPGVGCLTLMLWLNVISIVLGIAGLCVFAMLGIFGIGFLGFLGSGQ